MTTRPPSDRVGGHEPSPPRALCVCVDDFGLHAGVNAAALELAAIGRVQAIGCMVGGKAWPAGAASLRRLGQAQVDVGLHLDLTETPLHPRSRQGLKTLIASSLLRRQGRAALSLEINAQLEAFEAGMGRGPAFVDGHQHVHQLPVVREALLSALDRRYGTARPWLRSTRRVSAPVGVASGALVKSWFLERLGAAALESLAREQGYRQNRRLLGVYDFRGGSGRYQALLEGWLRVAATGDLLMCHPGVGHDGTDALAGARQAEFEVLSSPRLGFERIELLPMSRLLAAMDMAGPAATAGRHAGHRD